MDGHMFDGMGRALMWFYAFVGAVVALLGFGAGYVVWRVLQDHWR